MAGTITLGDHTIPFDEEIFAAHLDNQPDLVRNAFLTSGIMVEDGYLAGLIAGGGNFYTLPFYGNLADTADDNYDGKTDITLDTMGAAKQSGTVYGRAHGWYADDFVADFTAANPLAAIAARVSKYWQNKAQARLIGITEAVLGVSGMEAHTVTKTQLGATTLSDTAQEIWGDRKGLASMAVMHSAVAQGFEDMERVDYLKYTDANGVERGLNIYMVNGIVTIMDDGVPSVWYATAAGVYTVAVGGTPASGDVLTVNGVSVTLDATSAADATAAATALKTALEADATFNATYGMTRSTGTLTVTEKSGHYGAGAPVASVSTGAGSTLTVATTTAPANRTRHFATYLFQPGAIRHAPAPVAHPTFVDRDELKRGGMEYFGNRFREATHPNGFTFALPQVGGAPVISPTDAQLADTANWSLAYDDHRMIPFAKLLTPGHAA